MLIEKKGMSTVSQRILVLASVWPEAAASAASTRTLQLIGALQRAGYEVTCAADARESAATAALRRQGIDCQRQMANDSEFDRFVRELNPFAVIFDRFTLEEKFSWRVREQCPEALRILDTIDLHGLRVAREKALRAGRALGSLAVDQICEFAGDVLPREVAAIYRSDLTLLVSDVEIDFLTQSLGVPQELLQLCRLSYPQAGPLASFKERREYMMVGTFRHPPNEDAVFWLKQEVWPLIRRLHKGAIVHVWGAHAAPKHLQLSKPEQGFFVHGYLEDLEREMQARRVNLAPLRFGAGIKGKIADGWWSGLPAVTTTIGAEGMHEDLPFGGRTAEDPEHLAMAAVEIYHDEKAWTEARDAGQNILHQLYSEPATLGSFVDAMQRAWGSKSERRLRNFTGHLLWQQGLRSTEYFSRWIELKNKS
ncbi:MAG: glycosyltransferase [Oligoflexus sp.]